MAQEALPVSVIIPTLNEEDYLPVLLNSLAAIERPLQVIVVDGRSEDGTVAIAERFSFLFSVRGSSLSVVRSPVRRLSVQRNLGGHSATHDIILFLDADTAFPSHRSCERLIARFARSDMVIAAPFLVPVGFDPRAALMYASVCFFEAIASFFGHAYFNGACMIVRKKAFLECGGFNEALTLHEDIEFSSRMSRLGRCGLIASTIAVSSRRFRNYGYAHVFFGQWGRGLFLLLIDHIEAAQGTVYPFGVFSTASARQGGAGKGE